MYFVDKEIEVRYAETDQMGVVYHANYLVWLEIGRTAFAQSLGLSYAAMEASGVLAPVIHADIQYKAPARYGEKIIVRTYLKRVSNFRTIYYSEIYNQSGMLCVIAEMSFTCVDAVNFQVVSFKKSNPNWYNAYTTVMLSAEEYEQIKKK